jgi:hypothetical protein
LDVRQRAPVAVRVWSWAPLDVCHVPRAPMNWIVSPIDDHVARLFLPGRTRQLVAEPKALVACA